MPIEGLDSGQQLMVVPYVDQYLKRETLSYEFKEIFIVDR